MTKSFKKNFSSGCCLLFMVMTALVIFPFDESFAASASPAPSPSPSPSPSVSLAPTFNLTGILDPVIKIQRSDAIIREDPNDPLSPLSVNKSVQGIPVEIVFSSYEDYLNAFNVLGEPMIIDLNQMVEVFTAAPRASDDDPMILESVNGSLLDAITNAPYSLCGSMVAFGYFWLPDDKFLTLNFSNPFFARFFGDVGYSRMIKDCRPTGKVFDDVRLSHGSREEAEKKALECLKETCLIFNAPATGNMSIIEKQCTGHIYQFQRKIPSKSGNVGYLMQYGAKCLCDGGTVNTYELPRSTP